MAQTLLEAIQNNLQGQQPQATDETGKLQSLIRAKSGKASGGSAVAEPNLGEQSANNQTAMGLGQVAQQGQVVQAGQQQAQEQVQQADTMGRAQINQARNFDTVQNKLKTNAILSDLERNKGKVSSAQDQARLEQVGFNLRMQNTQYVDNLQREGAKARLDDNIAFSQQLQASVFGDQQAALEKKYGNQSFLNTSDRDFNKVLGNMDLNFAYDLFKNDMSTAKNKKLYGGLGALTTAGIGGYGTATKPTNPDEEEV